MYCLKCCYNVKRKSILLFLKRKGFLFVFSFTCVSSGLPSELLDSWNLNSDNEPVTKFFQCIISFNPPHSSCQHMNCLFLSQHCPFFAQSPFGKYPTGPRSSVLLDLIGERHLGAASDWSDLAAAAAHINVCCFHSANMIRSIWTWYLVPPWPTLWL